MAERVSDELCLVPITTYATVFILISFISGIMTIQTETAVQGYN